MHEQNEDPDKENQIRSLRTTGLFMAAAFSPDSKTLAVGSQLLASGDQVTMLDVATGAPRATLALPYIPAPGGLAFVRGGAWLVTAQSSGYEQQTVASTRMDLWEADNLQPIGDPLTVPLDAAFLSPNRSGDQLGAGEDADNGLPVVWNMDLESWEATACRIAGRNLSHAEWKQFLPGQPYQITCPQWPAGA